MNSLTRIPNIQNKIIRSVIEWSVGSKTCLTFIKQLCLKLRWQSQLLCVHVGRNISRISMESTYHNNMTVCIILWLRYRVATD